MHAGGGGARVRGRPRPSARRRSSQRRRRRATRRRPPRRPRRGALADVSRQLQMSHDLCAVEAEKRALAEESRSLYEAELTGRGRAPRGGRAARERRRARAAAAAESAAASAAVAASASAAPAGHRPLAKENRLGAAAGARGANAAAGERPCLPSLHVKGGARPRSSAAARRSRRGGGGRRLAAADARGRRGQTRCDRVDDAAERRRPLGIMGMGGGAPRGAAARRAMPTPPSARAPSRLQQHTGRRRPRRRALVCGVVRF